VVWVQWSHGNLPLSLRGEKETRREEGTPERAWAYSS